MGDQWTCVWCGAPLEPLQTGWTDVETGSGEVCPEGQAVRDWGTSPHLPQREAEAAQPVAEGPSVIRVHYGDPDSYARAYNAAFDDVAEQYGIRDRRLAELLGEWVKAWEGPDGDPYAPDNGPLSSIRSGLYAESKALLAIDAAAARAEQSTLGVEQLARALDAVEWHQWQSPQIDRIHTENLARAVITRLTRNAERAASRLAAQQEDR